MGALPETALEQPKRKNAGLRLFEAQRKQGTGLCVGLDIHYDPKAGIGEEFYNRFADPQFDVYDQIIDSGFRSLSGSEQWSFLHDNYRVRFFIKGVMKYFDSIIRTAWAEGVRVYKPQIAFCERLNPFGMPILLRMATTLRLLARGRGFSSEPFFILLDAKRGDIADTQRPYYEEYLAPPEWEVFPGMGGMYDFDAMTVTTWMGSDVLTPGLDFFRMGKGAVVVTRSSNPSGTTLQDLEAFSNHDVALSEKQARHRLGAGVWKQVYSMLGRNPTACEIMLHKTEEFVNANGLAEDGISPIFSVMGSTVKMDDSFRRLRPSGIPLIPGFGAQSGEFANVMPFARREGPNAGLVGVLASSRAHNFAWMEKYRGSGDPANWQSDLCRAIESFREDEKAAHRAADVPYTY